MQIDECSENIFKQKEIKKKRWKYRGTKRRNCKVRMFFFFIIHFRASVVWVVNASERVWSGIAKVCERKKSTQNFIKIFCTNFRDRSFSLSRKRFLLFSYECVFAVLRHLNRSNVIKNSRPFHEWKKPQKDFFSHEIEAFEKCWLIFSVFCSIFTAPWMEFWKIVILLRSDDYCVGFLNEQSRGPASRRVWNERKRSARERGR